MNHRASLLCCLLVVAIAASGEGRRTPPTAPPSSKEEGSANTCRYWCRQKKDGDAQYYCCEDDPENNGRDKNRMCPPERVFCPLAAGAAAPTPCQDDQECRGDDMCCYDVCLRHRTCKPSQIAARPLAALE